MPRCSFLYEYSETTPGPTQVVVFHRSTYSCVPRVADFFEVKNLQYVADPDDKVDRAQYTRSYFKADGTTGTVNVPAGEKVYNAYAKPNAKTVRLRTGRNAAGKKRTLTFTFPSYLTVSDIGDALSELLPATKVATTGAATPQQVEPFYTIVGGNTYPLKTVTQAEATNFPNLAKTPAEEITILARTTSRRGFFDSSP
jgi:hypothetical protein